MEERFVGIDSCDVLCLSDTVVLLVLCASVPAYLQVNHLLNLYC